MITISQLGLKESAELNMLTEQIIGAAIEVHRNLGTGIK